MGDGGHEQPGHIPPKRGCCLHGDGDRAHQSLWDHGDGHQGHGAELASEGDVPCPPPNQGHLSQDGGSPVGLGRGLSWGELPAPHPKTSQGSLRASKGSVFARHQCCLYNGEKWSSRGDSHWFLSRYHNGVDQLRLGYPMAGGQSPLGAIHRRGFQRYLFSFATFPPFRTGLSRRPLKSQRGRKPLRKDAAPGMAPPGLPPRSRHGGHGRML